MEIFIFLAEQKLRWGIDVNGNFSTTSSEVINRYKDAKNIIKRYEENIISLLKNDYPDCSVNISWNNFVDDFGREFHDENGVKTDEPENNSPVFFQLDNDLLTLYLEEAWKKSLRSQ